MYPSRKEELVSMNVKEKQQAILSGEYSAKANVLDTLKRIEERNEDLNIMLHINDEAVAQAEVIDEMIKRGEQVGKLAGLTVAIKSNICTTGLKANCASKTLENYEATYDADVIQRIREEHGIIIGMTNMDEFACGSSGETSAFNPTKNPANTDIIPGGSSSGSAAAVAADFADLAIGSDTGGSIRNPASHCGVVGIKPSYGRVSRYGLIDLAMSFDQIGPFAKDTYGAALLLEAIAGQSENDPTTIEKEVPQLSTFTEPQRIKIGICPQLSKLCEDKRIDEAVQAKAKEIAEKNDWEIKEIELPHIDLAVQAYYPIVYVEMFSGTRKFDGRKYGLKIEDSCGEEVLRRILGGHEISKAEHQGTYYRKALLAKAMIKEAFEKAFDQVDVILLPTTPRLPHKLGQETSVEDMYSYDAYTTPANLAEICGGVVPLTTIDNIPVGLQIYAKHSGERMLVDVMKKAEE
jgi:aspartyl-tRNA(Asn)/glutamyl-tRNA(Gln) amidotransferase subunit A